MKPAYAVPTMKDVSALRDQNGYTVVSTFSGCGGSCLGFEMAGFRIVRAHEFVPEAVAAYKANHPGVSVDDRDIRQVTGAEILAAIGMAPGELDVLEGSPPCASFSTAGARERGWGKVKAYSDTEQRSDDLFFEFARILTELRPKTFVAENVSGLVKGTAKGYFKEIFAALCAAGYRVEARLLDAQWLGVPQSRQRLFFVGVRDDLCNAAGELLMPAFPAPMSYRYTLTEAIADITTEPEQDTDISRFAIGREWHDTPIGGASSRYFQLVRPNPNLPVPTITATAGQSGAASVVHPTRKRKFSVAEVKRLCAFPDDFILTGTYQQQVERLGRSVPPLMARAVAEAVRDNVLGKNV